jgi:hypothetical protein
VPVFVVERFLPALTPEGVQAQAARERALVGLRHLRTTYLREDELCFAVFEAPSLAAVQRANDRTGMAYERITEAIDVTDDPSIAGPAGAETHTGTGSVR